MYLLYNRHSTKRRRKVEWLSGKREVYSDTCMRGDYKGQGREQGDKQREKGEREKEEKHEE